MVAIELVLGGIASVITGVVAAGRAKVWVWGWVCTDQAIQYEKVIADRDERIKEVRADRDRWQAIALRQAGILETSVKLVEKKADGG